MTGIQAEASPEGSHGAGAPAATTPLRLVTWNLNHWRQPPLAHRRDDAAGDYLTAHVPSLVFAHGRLAPDPEHHPDA
jgi:hypothetical protein